MNLPSLWVWFMIIVINNRNQMIPAKLQGVLITHLFGQAPSEWGQGGLWRGGKASPQVVAILIDPCSTIRALADLRTW